MKSLHLWLLAGTLLGLPARAEDFEIRIHRPLREGDKYKLSASGRSTENSAILRDGKIERESKTDFTAQLEAVATVLTVDHGKAIKQSLAVSKLTRTEEGRTKTILENATVLASFENKKRKFTVNGEEPAAEVQQALGLTVDIEKPGPTDDEIFGTSERKKIGDTWPVNLKLLAEAMEDSGAAAQGISAKGTLTDVVKDAGGRSLLVSIDVTATPVLPLPPNMTVDKSTLKMTLSGRFPVDTTRIRPEDKVEMEMSAHAKGGQPDGSSAEINISARQSGVFKRSPVR
jgi:hypothetical protein